MKELNEITTFCRQFINRNIELPIRASDMGFLILLSREQNLTASQASNYFNVSKPMIASMVKRLFKNCYIEKEISQQDKRIHYLRLTKKGEKLVKESYNEYKNFTTNLKKQMGTIDYNKLIKYINLANKAIKEME